MLHKLHNYYYSTFIVNRLLYLRQHSEVAFEIIWLIGFIQVTVARRNQEWD